MMDLLTLEEQWAQEDMHWRGGTQTSALAFGGPGGSNQRKYDGSSWTAGGAFTAEQGYQLDHNSSFSCWRNSSFVYASHRRYWKFGQKIQRRIIR